MKKLFIIVSLLLCFSLNVNAEWTTGTTSRGSINIQLVDPTTKGAITKATYTFYKVADATENNGSYTYTYTNDFSGCTASLDNLSSSDLCNLLVNYINTNNISGQSVSADKYGNVNYSNISLGLYLAVNTSIKSGYNTTAAFLVTVPVVENGVTTYNVDANPKITISNTPGTPGTSVNPEPTDVIPSQIPTTGVVWWPVTVFAVAGLLLVAAGYIKKFKYEKTI